MLTIHNYQDISDDWNKEILDCCKANNNGDTTCEDCCYDTWDDELKTVTQRYNSLTEQAAQLQSKLTFVTDRRNRYKAWNDEISNARELSIAIRNQLEIIAVQSDKIWYNSCQALIAIKKLFFMIRDFFTQLDLIKTRYDDVQNCITNNTDPSLIRGQGILKALDDYKAKLDIVMKSRDEVIKNIIVGIQYASLIVNSISTRECNCKDDSGYKPCTPQKSCDGNSVFYGFKTVICEWFKEFDCDTPATGEATTANPAAAPAPSPINSGSIQNDCSDENCELKPAFEFPLCNDTYKNCVQKWLDADDTAVAELTSKLKEANKEKEALTACRNSLIKAIKAVDPKTRCN